MSSNLSFNQSALDNIPFFDENNQMGMNRSHFIRYTENNEDACNFFISKDFAALFENRKSKNEEKIFDSSVSLNISQKNTSDTMMLNKKISREEEEAFNPSQIILQSFLGSIKFFFTLIDVQFVYVPLRTLSNLNDLKGIRVKDLYERNITISNPLIEKIMNQDCITFLDNYYRKRNNCFGKKYSVYFKKFYGDTSDFEKLMVAHPLFSKELKETLDKFIERCQSLKKSEMSYH